MSLKIKSWSWTLTAPTTLRKFSHGLCAYTCGAHTREMLTEVERAPNEPVINGCHPLSPPNCSQDTSPGEKKGAGLKRLLLHDRCFHVCYLISLFRPFPRRESVTPVLLRFKVMKARKRPLAVSWWRDDYNPGVTDSETQNAGGTQPEPHHHFCATCTETGSYRPEGLLSP